MRRIIYLFLIAILATSCKDKIDIDYIGSKPKLVVYSFPTASDSTIITVSESIPVHSKDYSSTIDFIDYAIVTYRVNGNPCEVVSLGKGRYKAYAKQKSGDRISISVSAPDMDDVSAETYIPTKIDISATEKRDIRIYSYLNEGNKLFTQYYASFSDPKNEPNFYATRVRIKTKATKEDYYTTGKGEYYSNYYVYPSINTQSEDLLHSATNIDDLFDISNSFYGGLYIFDDSMINGKTYTLHLNVDGDYIKRLGIDHKGEVELLHLTPEFYKFLYSINAQENELFPGTGLSQTTPTQTNVKGGLGLVAGYNNSLEN